MMYFVLFCLIENIFGVSAHSVGGAVENFIIGGRNATIEEYPYQLSLEKMNRPVCGASIMSKNWALTAAHCLKSNDTSIYKIRAGSTFRYEGGQLYTVNKVISHMGYESWFKDSDIGLMQIDGEFDIGNKQQIISLEETGESIEVGTMAVITGWGWLTNVLTIPIISQEECANIFPTKNIGKNMLCAGHADQGKTTCKGDSGGPLVVDGKQVGIVSFGKRACSIIATSVYARVSALREWIRENSGV